MIDTINWCPHSSYFDAVIWHIMLHTISYLSLQDVAALISRPLVAGDSIDVGILHSCLEGHSDRNVSRLFPIWRVFLARAGNAPLFEGLDGKGVKRYLECVASVFRSSSIS